MKIVLHLHYILYLADLSKFYPKCITKTEAIHFKVTVTSEVLGKKGQNLIEKYKLQHFRNEGLTEQWLFFFMLDFSR